MRHPLPLTLAASLAALALAAPAARAQTTCRTSNCAGSATPPAACQSLAAPRTLRVAVASFSFTPSRPVIEPGDCIFWDATGGPHSAASDTCPDDGVNSCANPAPPACKWDTGNVTGPPSPNVDATCSFGASAFPADSQWGFYCRQHDNPNHNGVPGMSGTLKVSRLIVLSAIRSAAAASLSWTGGDGTFKVEIAANDRTFNTGRTTTDPIGGSAGTTYSDAVIPPAGTARYYLVRNKQSNDV